MKDYQHIISATETMIDEPLRISAPLARQHAPELCETDPSSQLSCAWNHGLWQYLRLLELITTPRHHAEFFKKAFGLVNAGEKPTRVLVSGAADYSMLAHVLAIFGARNFSPAVTVVDRCRTPLFLNQWYADQLPCSIVTRHADILEYQDESGFDLVCSHSFLGQFDPPRRARLMDQWRNLLRPGGWVVTVNRIRPAGVAPTVGFSDEQARSFSDMVLRQAEALKQFIDVNPAQLAEEARIYAGKQGAYPVRSLEEIRALFERAGFRMEQLTCAPVTTGINSAVSGPTTPGDAEYACIVARRI